MPAAIDLGVILAMLVALLASYGLLYAYRSSLKQLLLLVAGAFRIRIGIPHVGGITLDAVANAIENVANAIDHALASLVLACEKSVIVLWHGLAQQAKWLGKVLAELAETVEGKFKWWMALFPPAAAVWAAVKAVQGLDALAGEIRKLTRNAIASVRAQIVAVKNEAIAELDRLGRGIDRTRAKVVTGLAAGAATIAWLRNRLTGALGRLHRVESKVTAIGAAALVGTALARLGLKWIRCARVTKTGKRVCAMDSDLLDSLLAGTVLLGITLNLREFTALMQDGIEEAAPAVRTFWRATG